MKYLIVFAAVVALIATGVASHPPGGNEDHDNQRPEGPPRDPFMMLFDTDRNGEISTQEIEQASGVLRNLDRDQSGTLTRDELPRPPHPPRHHPPHRDEHPRPEAGRPPHSRIEALPDQQRQNADLRNVPADSVVFTGGYETDLRDHGRPVALIAAALGVEPEVFRQAFSNVKPARGGAPSAARVRANKEVLMSALGKQGITNDRLDTVSNYYRY